MQGSFNIDFMQTPCTPLLNIWEIFRSEVNIKKNFQVLHIYECYLQE